MSDPTPVDPTTQESLANAAQNAGIPQTSGDLDAEGQPAAAAAAGDSYDDMTNEQLKDELRGRTDTDGNALAVSGTKDELIARLRDNDSGA